MCGLPWNDHGRDPNTDDCIRLLKAELAKRVQYVPIQIPVPCPRPSRWEEWYNRSYYPPTITYGGESKESSFGGAKYNECTPKLLCTTTSPSM